MSADASYPAGFHVRQSGDAVVPTGKSIDVESGGALKIAGVAVAATAAQIDAAAAGTGNQTRSSATPAAAGNSQGTGTALTADLNAVTAADGTKGVVLPTAFAGADVLVINTDASSVLKVYPATGAQINALGANAALSLAPGEAARFVGRSATLWYTAAAGAQFDVVGVAAGYKVARGTRTQVAASDTVATGLTTVVAVVYQFKSAPTVKQLFCCADVGDQAGTPAAGSFLAKTFKPTAVNDVTPVPATDFTDNLKFDWVAVGT